ncbi:MAG TPA: cation diffusion facilitator family transporter [Mycobacterium sp.]|uniref:cation diffusion facilitator family transporter n=1 Tax=Mycobacterium sp. TaxID=1785 RepID=UPI002C313C68|nr:cation diffusion facilitator family transporter [Mycobacterium sp.]HME74647.1 cation diffusion facilitator family transporter [Mycobacterium sp.]
MNATDHPDSARAIVAALAANLGIAAAKFAGFVITGSAAMMAESVHSVADIANQGLLLLGQRSARKQADTLHSFGYGRSRYFWSFVVALLIFTLGAGFALYEGCRKVAHPEPLTSPVVALAILIVTAGLEAYSFYTARTVSRSLKGNKSWWRFIRDSRDPELPVVLLEDTADLIGLTLAMVGVGLTVLTGSSVWDGVATLAIGVLLGAVAVFLMVEMHSLLIGESATASETAEIREALESTDYVDRVIHLRTQYLGPDELLVAAKVSVAPGVDLATVASAIDAAEVKIRTAVPAARIVYIEPDIDRA